MESHEWKQERRLTTHKTQDMIVQTKTIVDPV